MKNAKSGIFLIIVSLKTHFDFDICFVVRSMSGRARFGAVYAVRWAFIAVKYWIWVVEYINSRKLVPLRNWVFEYLKFLGGIQNEFSHESKSASGESLWMVRARLDRNLRAEKCAAFLWSFAIVSTRLDFFISPTGSVRCNPNDKKRQDLELKNSLLDQGSARHCLFAAGYERQSGWDDKNSKIVKT